MTARKRDGYPAPVTSIDKLPKVPAGPAPGAPAGDQQDSPAAIRSAAPDPRAGDVWRLATGRTVVVFDQTSEYRVRSLFDNMYWFEVDDLDFTGAELLHAAQPVTRKRN